MFTFLRKKYKSVFFLKNGFECDFLVFDENKNPLLIQVTEKLHIDNIDRELNGLLKSSKKIKNAKLLLLINSKENNLIIPDDIEVKEVWDWMIK